MADKTIIQSLPALPNPIPQSAIQDDRVFVGVKYSSQSVPNSAWTAMTNGAIEPYTYPAAQSLISVNASGHVVFARKCMFSVLCRISQVSPPVLNTSVTCRIAHYDSSGTLKVTASAPFHSVGSNDYINREGNTITFPVEAGDYFTLQSFQGGTAADNMDGDLIGSAFNVSEV